MNQNTPKTILIEIRINPSEYSVLLTVPPLTTIDDKEIMTEIMFNKFNDFTIQSWLKHNSERKHKNYYQYSFQKCRTT